MSKQIFYITGKTGVGKTNLALQIYKNYFINKNEKIPLLPWINFSKPCEEYPEEIDKNGYFWGIKHLKDIAILDNIGPEYYSNFNRKNLLNILNFEKLNIKDDWKKNKYYSKLVNNPFDIIILTSVYSLDDVLKSYNIKYNELKYKINIIKL